MTKTTRTWAICIVLCLLSFSKLVAQDKIQYKEYSYTEFFKMIEDEENSVFRLQNALISPNAETDQYFLIRGLYGLDNDPLEYTQDYDSLIVDKAIVLTNVQFIYETDKRQDGLAFLHHIHFKKKVTLNNVGSIPVANCTFDQGVAFNFYESMHLLMENKPRELLYFSTVKSSHIKNGLYYFKIGLDRSKELEMVFFLSHSLIEQGNNQIIIADNKQSAFGLVKNEFKGESARISSFGGNSCSIVENTFDLNQLTIDTPNGAASNFTFQNNKITGYTNLGVLPSESTVIDWPQFQGKAIYSNTYSEIRKIYDADSLKSEEASIYDSKYLDIYFARTRVENAQVYKNEQRLKGRFINLYRLQNDIEYANMVYVESKDLETNRLGYLYLTDKSFKTFFSWKINQFLRVFSAYGTEPARAIIFSVYVIIAFALVYLFFPNHWDAHGKDRILHRYQFFFKYLNKDAGMHDVYLEGKQDELAHYDGFKNFFIENGKTVPKFFLATALPLYRWSTASTRSTSWFLQKIDIFKGKWADLPAPQRAAKTVLLTLAFAIALTYDILIKMLNALMLSINTFTTLGFGEIPIKGLPRYLAIIQGFIGWFMLTIFSVSLISQLLN